MRGPGKDDPDAIPEDALTEALSLLTAGGSSLDVAELEVPSAPGLYAVTGDDDVWVELELTLPADDRPLYVGKAERSLASRDVRTHFATGKTGSSTLRRALAGLLAARLDLRAQPRNPSKPGYFSNFGLEAAGDERLTAWMRDRLRLAVWPSPAGMSLDAIETLVLQHVEPPLNLSKVRTPWGSQVKAARAQLASQARQWRPDGS